MNPTTKQQTLNVALKQLANWALVRSVGEHDADTTLSLLQRKVAEMRARVQNTTEAGK
jgi:hypothetical protein